MESGQVQADQAAHLREHAIEVQLPLLVARQPRLRLTPICLAGLDLADCEALGKALAGAITATGESVLIVASTDMSHYVSAEQAKRLDRLALDHVIELNPAGLYQTVREHDISMCGYVPTTVALFAALELGATRARLVRYGNSGETSGDFARVVGYAGGFCL
jgi:AmmeMemoRadiSam system protein B